MSNGQPGSWAHQGTFYHDLLQDQLENPILWAAIGRIYDRQREFAKAASSYRQGLEFDPTDAEVASAWARSALAAGDYDQAKDAIRQLRSIDPLRVGPALLEHPVMVEGRKSEEASKAKEKPLQIKIEPRTSGLLPQRENKNTVPPQDPTQNAAPRQL